MNTLQNQSMCQTLMHVPCNTMGGQFLVYMRGRALCTKVNCKIFTTSLRSLASQKKDKEQLHINHCSISRYFSSLILEICVTWYHDWCTTGSAII